MLMKLGALLGDKTPAEVMDLPGEKWLWDTRDTCPEPSYTYSVPPAVAREVSIVGQHFRPSPAPCRPRSRGVPGCHTQPQHHP